MYVQLPYGVVHGLAPLCFDSNDPVTQLMGVSKRMGRKLPEINPATLAKFEEFVKEELQNVPPLAPTEIMTFDQWLAEAPYPMWRKDELRTEYESCHGCPTDSECERIKSFQKTESYPEWNLPRGINSRVDAFKAYSGPYFKSIEKRIYHWPEFVKHVPVAERPSLIRSLIRAGARYFVTDYSSFEASFRSVIMKVCECALYRHMLKLVPEVADKICRVISGRNRGSMRCGLKFVVDGRRMSGDMCTSLGNGFTNLMIFRFLMRGRNARILVEGDDGLAFVYDDGPLPQVSQYAELGFSIKIKVIEDPMMASFCGVVCPGGATVRNPFEVLSTFGWSSSDIGGSLSTRKRLLRAKALSLCYELPHCPILRPIADRALYLTRGFTPKYVLDGFHSPPPDEFAIPEYNPPTETRLFFAREYGLSLELQLEIEKLVSITPNLDWLGQLLPAQADLSKYAALYVDAG